jgi:hypothetical protein
MDMQGCLANILSKRRTERGCCIRRCEQVLTGDFQGRHHRTLLMARAAVLVSMLRRSYFYFIFFLLSTNLPLRGRLLFCYTTDYFGFSFLSSGLLWSPRCLDIVCH